LESAGTTTLITGDLAFVYDTNGLWHHHVSDSLRIIVIDNGGGNIFKYIDGPDSVEELEEFFVTPSAVKLHDIATAYGLQVIQCNSENDLNRSLKALYDSDTPTALLIATNGDLSPRVLRDYFEELKS